MDIKFIKLTDEELNKPAYVRVDAIEYVKPSYDYMIYQGFKPIRPHKTYTLIQTKNGFVEAKEDLEEIMKLIKGEK